MAPPILTKHKITYTEAGASKVYYFLANPVTYQGISTAASVQEASDNEINEKNTDVSELLGSGDIVRAHIYYVVNGVRKTAKILVPTSRFTNFRRTQINKPYRGGIIKGIKQPRRASFY